MREALYLKIQGLRENNNWKPKRKETNKVNTEEDGPSTQGLDGPSTVGSHSVGKLKVTRKYKNPSNEVSSIAQQLPLSPVVPDDDILVSHNNMGWDQGQHRS
ncbi:uncharacterized protein [Spinacia oleracea]|uniref:Uncharacterized protein n=1 Tax=Spinacia oleracea TaxID=3562 RepID=A0ABM3R6Y2_SPIOL|nr:uncharacterized protein LOC130466798 [Spinacia oleracea]